MNIHEYQAREILQKHGVPVPGGSVASTPEEVEQIAKQLGGTVVIKAQVHTGGRGKAGGVKLADSPADAKDKASKILGMQIKGLTVEKVLVAPAEDIASEAYVGVIVDRASKRAVFMVSREGGIDIEEVAEKHPEHLSRTHFSSILPLSRKEHSTGIKVRASTREAPSASMTTSAMGLNILPSMP